MKGSFGVNSNVILSTDCVFPVFVISFVNPALFLTVTFTVYSVSNFNLSNVYVLLFVVFSCL